MWVVKLGGSLDGAGTMNAWVETLAACDTPLIICPGGGNFANAVRAVQRRWPIDDAAAHRMAILAMEQTAYLLCGLGARFNPVSYSPSVRTPQACQRVSVWFPAAELINDPEIPCTWQVTSDSLSAILARRIGAQGLALIKSAPLPESPTHVGLLQRAGLLDGAFNAYGRHCGCPVWLLPGDDSEEFHRLMLRGEGGRRVLFNP